MSNSDTEPVANTKIFKYLVISGVILILTAVILIFIKNLGESSNRLSTCPTPHVNLPDNFDEIELPAQVGCWRLKLDPDKFSGKVWFPRGRRFDARLEWENKDSLYQVQNQFGKIFTINPKGESDLGCNHGNDVLRYKGNGHVKIYILRIWSPMQQF